MNRANHPSSFRAHLTFYFFPSPVFCCVVLLLCRERKRCRRTDFVAESRIWRSTTSMTTLRRASTAHRTRCSLGLWAPLVRCSCVVSKKKSTPMARDPSAPLPLTPPARPARARTRTHTSAKNARCSSAPPFVRCASAASPCVCVWAASKLSLWCAKRERVCAKVYLHSIQPAQKTTKNNHLCLHLRTASASFSGARVLSRYAS